jgi:hypothetical protein
VSILHIFQYGIFIGYIAEKEHLLKIVHDAKIVKHLLSLLSSSSFTVILNTLGVLGILVRDQRTQLKLVQSDHARLILDNLSNSSRDDIRNAVKILLTYLNGSPLSGFAMTLPSTSKINARKGQFCLYKIFLWNDKKQNIHLAKVFISTHTLKNFCLNSIFV